MLFSMVTIAPVRFSGSYGGKKLFAPATSSHSSLLGSLRPWHFFDRQFSISRILWRLKATHCYPKLIVSLGMG